MHNMNQLPLGDPVWAQMTIKELSTEELKKYN